MDKVKQVIVIRKDVKMSKGKLAVQCCHAAVECYKNTSPSIRRKWISDGQKKVILYAKNLDELLKLKAKADKMNLPCVMITDAGLTEIKKGTITCLGIGPAQCKEIDKITGSLPLVR